MTTEAKITAPDVSKPPELWVQAIVLDLDTSTYTLALRFRDVAGAVGSLHVERALMREPSKVYGLLLDAGAVLPQDRKTAIEAICKALNGEAVERYATTRRAGWHGPSFVTPNRTFGEAKGTLKFAGSSTSDPGYGLRRGSFDEWQEGLGKPCEASSFLTFAVAVGYAAPLLDILGEDEGAIFNLHGRSSSGKSLASRVLQSEAGRAGKADLATFDMTDRAIEELCFSRNEAIVVFDEEGRNTGGATRSQDRRRKLAFMVPGGRGTIRSQKVAKTADLPNLSWRLFGLSSGEEPLETATARRRAGEQVRHIDIKVPDPSVGGIFDRLEGDQTARVKEAIRLAAVVEGTIAANYGVARSRYLAALVRQRSEVTDKARAMVADIITCLGADADSWERRFALKFAIVAAGGMLAAEFGVAPFDPDHARRCVIWMYRAARRSVFSIEETYSDVFARLRRAVADASCFPRIEKGESLPRKLRDEAWGFRRKHANGIEFVAIDPARFEALVGSAPTAEAVLDLLITRNVALSGVGGKRRPQIAVQGFPRAGRSRWVCLRASAF